MKTWRLEHILEDVAAAAGHVLGLALAPVLDWVYPPSTNVYDEADRFDTQLGGVHVADGAPWSPSPECPNPSDCSEYDCAGDCSEAAPNLYEPALTDDELVAVRGLIQERYSDPVSTQRFMTGIPDGDQSLKADRVDAEMWRATVGGRKIPPGYRPHQAIPDHNGYCKAGVGGGELCDLNQSHPIHTTSPADAVSTGDGPAGECDASPPATSPPAGIPEFAWEKWLTPAIWTALADHYPLGSAVGRIFCTSVKGPHANFADEQEWREHVTPYLIDAVKTAIDVAGEPRVWPGLADKIARHQAEKK